MKKISYKEAGVDIDKGNAFVQAIKPMMESTFRPEEPFKRARHQGVDETKS